MARGLALFLLAFMVRSLFLGDARWTSEESYFFAWVHDVAWGDKWDGMGTPVSGSTAWHPGPWFFAVLAPFAWISTSPWAVAFGVAFIDSIAVVLSWLGLRGLWGQKRAHAAWLTGLLLALSPWALLYADRPWNSNLVSFPAALILFGLGAWWQGGHRRWPLALAVVGAALFPSFHLSAPIYWVPMLTLLFLGRSRGYRGLLIGLGLGLALQLPYLTNELRSDFRNSRLLVAGENAHPQRSWSNSLLALSWPVRMTTMEIGYHAQEGYWHDYDASAPLLRPASEQGRMFWQTHRGIGLVALAASLILAIFCWIRWLRGLRWREMNEDPFSLFLILGTLAGWLLILLASRRAYPHYLQPLLPFYLGVIGLGVASLYRSHRRWVPAGVWCLLLLGLAPTTLYYAERDRPFGLAANLATLDAVEQLGGKAQVLFCGRMNYRSSIQLGQIARISHPKVSLKGREGLLLVHLDSPDLQGELYRHALWQRYAHGHWMVLVDRPLPRTFRLLNCPH